jgi:hypothetical protein
MEITAPVETRMYVVVRGDLPAGCQIAQSAHAVAELVGRTGLEAVRRWPVTVVLNATDENHLSDLMALAEVQTDPGQGPAPFYEPDLELELTAFAVFCGSDLFAHLQLAGTRRSLRRRVLEVLRRR